MAFLRRIFESLRQMIHLLKSRASRSREWPGNINVQRKLSINSPIADPRPCTREQATRLYRTLSGFQQQMAALSAVKDLEQLEAWFSGYNNWTDANWGPVYANLCDGTALFARALRAVSTWRVLSTVTNISGQIPAEATMEILSNLSAAEPGVMDQGTSPYVWLLVNRITREMPLCNESRTEAFYGTADQYEKQARALMDVDSYESLQDWVFAFHEWREDAWGVYYDNPCGQVLEKIYYLESRIYLAASMQYNEYASGAAKVLTNAINEWRSQAAQDMAIVRKHGSA